jgi:hypothetical protein
MPTISPISTKPTIISHLNWSNMTKTRTYDVGNSGPGLGQAQTCDGIKHLSLCSTDGWYTTTNAMPHVFIIKSSSESEYVESFLIISLYMYFCLRSHYQKGYAMIPLSGLIPSQVCACPKPGPEFPTSYVQIINKDSTYTLSLDDLIINTCGIAFVVVYHPSVEHKLK